MGKYILMTSVIETPICPIHQDNLVPLMSASNANCCRSNVGDLRLFQGSGGVSEPIQKSADHPETDSARDLAEN